MTESHLVKETLVDLLYKTIKKDITKKILFPGKKVIIRELSERYGVSETPIKQALNRLVSEGLIESIPRRGMRVKEVKWEDIKEIIEVRYMVETFCIKPAIKAIQKDENIKKRFTEIIAQHKEAVEKITDVESYLEHFNLDQKFHNLFVECSGNNKIIEIYHKIGTHMYMYHIYGKQQTNRMIEAFHEHKAIYNALMEMDEQKLFDCISMHIKKSEVDMKNII